MDTTQIARKSDRSKSQLALPLPKVGDLSRVGWTLPENLTEQDWVEAGRALSRIEGALTWWIGDWWAFGEHRYGARKELTDSDDWEGPSFQTCADAASVCRQIESSRRRELLSYSFHRECLGLPADEADRLLLLAETDGLTRKALREKVKEIKRLLAEGWNSDQLDRRKLVEDGGTVLLNLGENADKKPIDGALQRWGEANDLLVRIDRTSDWGNPFILGEDGDRETVIRNYQWYLDHKPSLLDRLDELQGKILGCWCYPEPCHGHILIQAINWEEPVDGERP